LKNCNNIRQQPHGLFAEPMRLP
jgi:hypothetical protein